MIYQWKAGARVGLDAQAAGEELERIRVHHNGRLQAEAVVDAARPKASILHPHFEWDDRAAAEQFRVEQAKYLVRSITVRMEKPSGAKAPIRAFVSVERDEDRSYTSLAHAMSDAELRAQVLEQAWRELEAWRQRHAELVELAEIFAAIDQARAA